MDVFSNIASSLHLLGKAIEPQSITKVEFSTSNTESDLPDQVMWRIKATLSGTKGVSSEGEGVELAFKQEWFGDGVTEEEAFSNAYRSITKFMAEFQRVRQSEASFAEQALMVIHSKPLDLSTIWPSSNEDSQVGGDQ